MKIDFTDVFVNLSFVLSIIGERLFLLAFYSDVARRLGADAFKSYFQLATATIVDVVPWHLFIFGVTEYGIEVVSVFQRFDVLLG